MSYFVIYPSATYVPSFASLLTSKDVVSQLLVVDAHV